MLLGNMFPSAKCGMNAVKEAPLEIVRLEVRGQT